MKINRVDQFNLALSIGPWAWPGGYPYYFLCSDGEALSFKAAQENAGLIRDAIIANDGSGGWRVLGMDINWEDNDLYCSHTNNKIESAYGEEDESD